jgi:dynein heavy chain, axonemal
MAEDKKTLKNIENTILKMLTESTEEQILDEDTLINVLDESKITSTEINARIADATVVEETINQTRLGYKSVAIRGSIIYFVIADMARVNDMYQNSLQFVKTLFNKAIDASEPGETFEARLDNLIKVITSLIFTNISRGLFERDKLIFSFFICTSIDRKTEKIKPVSWNLLLRGTATITENDKKKQPPNPLPKNILTDLAADYVWSAEIVEPEIYGGLTESFKENEAVWLEWATCEKPHIDPLPLDWHEKVSDFEKLIILKAFRPEKIAFAFQLYVLDNMGKFYIESQTATMEVVYADTDTKTPLIFILSTGADPTA